MEDIYTTLLFLTIFLIIILIFWFIPIWYGVKWAKIKGVSKLWMLFGFHPVTGWITYLIIRYGVDPKKECEKCKELIKIEAQICRYCGTKMSQEEINFAINEYQYKKK